MEKKQNSLLYVLRISLILLIICSLTAAAVSLVYGLTHEKAEENLLGEKRTAMAEIYGDGISVEEIAAPETVDAVYRITKGNELLGYCVSVTGSGFGGDLDVLVGYHADGTILGVRLISHSETPGLGSRVGENEYLEQYAGQSGELTLGEDIDAISGSTISSSALLDAVNTANSAAQAIVKGES